MGGGSGSTILARQELSQNIFSIILIVVIVVFLVICVYFISKIITKYHNSPEFLEKQKKRPTSQKDINEVASACILEKEEREILIEFCRKNKSENLIYLMKDLKTFDKLLKNLYKEFELSSDEKSVFALFSLRKKIFSTYNQKAVVKNTKLLEPGTNLIYTKEKGFHYRLTLVENQPDAMVLDIPIGLEEGDFPKPLEKISLVFESSDGTPYTVESRIVRFQEEKENKKQIIAVHSDKISNLQKREQERAEMDSPCKFNSVKSSEDKKGRTLYILGEKDYDGDLEDISAGGCKISTYLPIKAGQLINIKGLFNKKQTDTAVGVIVRTTKRSDEVFVLHIKFLEIDLAAVNRINAMVIHYDE